MNDEELNVLLTRWEEACTFAHGGQARKTPLIVASKLIVAGDYLRDAIEALHERER